MAEIKRDIKYVNKDFADLRRMLIEYAKNYYPDTYSDFNESSPGMMFIEMAAAVGDVLSLYSDVQLQESLLGTADERINIYNIAQSFGYKPTLVTPAQVDLEVMQLVPALGSGNDVSPDYNYAVNINSGMIVANDDGVQFRTTEDCNFRFSSSYSPTTVSPYQVNNSGEIEFYLLKKTVKAVSGEVRTSTYEFGESKKYDKITINDENVVQIIDIYDSDGEKWHEVPFLAQDMVPIQLKNMPYNDPELSNYMASVPYLLAYQKVEKRFVTRLRRDNLMEIQFGAGLGEEQDEEIVPSPFNVALGLDYFRRVEDVSIDPTNFLYTKTYGRAPSNTTLTVRYSVSNGLSENLRSGELVNIISSDIDDLYGDVSQATVDAVLDSITVNNPEPAYGGKDMANMEKIRQEAMAYFAAQNRAVTRNDIMIRAYSMPPKFGSVSKVYVEQDMQNSQFGQFERIPNPYALNLYVLSYDDNKNLVPANPAIKYNLSNYLSEYRMSTDAINIRDAFIVNIGINYSIITRPDTDSYEVLAKCTQRLKELFSPDRMEINQPLYLNNIRTELDKVEGVQTVVDIEIENLNDSDLGYSPNEYDMEAATRNGIVYPSVDPCIFEVKNLNRDIRGSVVDY